MKISLNENSLRNVIRETVKNVLSESFGHYKSGKLAGIIKQHGVDKYNSMLTNYLLTQLRDDNVCGVSDKPIDKQGLHSLALGDGTYVVFNTKDNKYAQEFCGSTCVNFTNKYANEVRPNNGFAKQREFNHIPSDFYSRKHFKPMTRRGEDARSLRHNPYFINDKNKEVNHNSGWYRGEANRVMNNLRSGNGMNGEKNTKLNENKFKNPFDRFKIAIYMDGKKNGLSDEEIKEKMLDKLAQMQAEHDINKEESERRIGERGINTTYDKTTDFLANTDFNDLWDIDMNNIN